MDTATISRDYVVYGSPDTDAIPDSFFSGVRDVKEGRTLPMDFLTERHGFAAWCWRAISIYAFKLGSMFDRLGVFAFYRYGDAVRRTTLP